MDSRPRTPASTATTPTITTGPSSTAVGGGITQPAGALDNISASIQRCLALLHLLHCSVSSFTLQNQLALLERLNGVMKELSFMQSAADDCHIQIPIDVIRFIDEGRNPDEFTKDLINNCIQRNQATKGKVDAFKNQSQGGTVRVRYAYCTSEDFKMLREHLLEEIEDAYPEETEAYRALRTASALESRRISQAQSLLANGDVKVKSEH